ncbi:hypothetical protein B0H21DRAFT_688018 [Amylocystis lapponica]|nr:hypothetical protein B0H21DRAFT_688018 [Amylocystis lapponica]
MSRRFPKYRHTHVVPYFISLLAANVIQGLATVLGARWLVEGAVKAGPYCSIQGGLKNAGNVAMAVWSFVMAVHVFLLLFLRRGTRDITCAITLAIGWLTIALIVCIGPLAVQTEAKGTYFGPSGYWCWITDSYPMEQIFLEYFIEFVSAGVSFFLYTAILLRVRGNLVIIDGKWCLRFVPRGERWQLAISRDVTDSSMMQVAARMVWHPVAYSVLLLPVTLARFIAFGGHEVPFWATVSTDFIFNLQGIVNVILLVGTRHLIPDTALLPIFTPRKGIDASTSEAYGITPFVLSKPEAAEKPLPSVPPVHAVTGVALERVNSQRSVLTVASGCSVDSQTLLLG